MSLCRLKFGFLLVWLLFVWAFSFGSYASAHIPGHPHSKSDRDILKFQENAYAHARYVCVRGSGEPKRWHCAVSSPSGWLTREIRKMRAKLTPSWIDIQIHYATIIGRDATVDPWPNCPDPIWNPGSTWQDTVNCENSGNWYDSPGFFRCGLQFHPMWEAHFGVRFCP